MTSGEVTIHIISPDAGGDETGNLTEGDRQRAATFRFPGDAKHWAACRAALRRILGRFCGLHPRDVPIVPGRNGKPALTGAFAGIHFNLSHCHDLALVVVGGSPVGIDIESLGRAPDLLGCESSFCHPREINLLPVDPEARSMKLLEIWTAKEAILKALGTGLLQPPEEVRLHFADHVSASSDKPLEGLANHSCHRLLHPKLERHLAFVSIATLLPDLIFIDETA